MITAKEACELSNSNAENNLQEEIKHLEEAILRATSRGVKYVYLYDKISDEARAKLEKNGYHVEILYTLRDGYSVKIHWADGCD